MAQGDATPELRRATDWLTAGRAEDAWKLLSAREFDQAGNEHFDYLLGLAALESGRADRSTFVFERVLATNPDHAGARVDMGRAYFALGDTGRAKTEFEIARRLNPPPAARATIDRHLEAIEQFASGSGRRFSAYLEVGAGTDSNLNAGVSGGAYSMPIFGNATISSRDQRANYQQFGGGGEFGWSFGQNSEVFVGADARRRQNGHRGIEDLQRDTGYYDTRAHDLRLGAQHRLNERNALRLTIGYGRQSLDDTDGYRAAQTVAAEWRHSFDASTQGSLWLQDQRARFGSVAGTSYRQYGGNQLIGGAALARGFGAGNAVVASISAFGGAERATDIASGNLDGDKRIGGLRIGGQYRVIENVDMLASFGALYNRYELTNVLFLERRRDVAIDVGVGAVWRIDRDWSLKPQYVFSRSDSNIGAYDYDRHDVSLTLRRDFR